MPSEVQKSEKTIALEEEYQVAHRYYNYVLREHGLFDECSHQALDTYVAARNALADSYRADSIDKACSEIKPVTDEYLERKEKINKEYEDSMKSIAIWGGVCFVFFIILTILGIACDE